MALFGCANLRQTQQVDMVVVRVVKIDTIARHPGKVKQLTWRDQDDIQYISYISIKNTTYEVGTSMYVMRKR
jgi:hypothetical protein